MQIENKKDYGEFIRSGARITLKLLVNYVNERMAANTKIANGFN